MEERTHRRGGIDSQMWRNRLTDVENRLTDMENRLPDMESRLTDMESRLTDVENRLPDMEEQACGCMGRGKGEMEWAFGVSRCKLVDIAW